MSIHKGGFAAAAIGVTAVVAVTAQAGAQSRDPHYREPPVPSAAAQQDAAVCMRNETGVAGWEVKYIQSDFDTVVIKLEDRKAVRAADPDANYIMMTMGETLYGGIAGYLFKGLDISVAPQAKSTIANGAFIYDPETTYNIVNLPEIPVTLKELQFAQSAVTCARPLFVRLAETPPKSGI